MKKLCVFGFVLALVITLAACQSKQPSAPESAAPTAEATPPLVLTQSVSLAGVKGRFDHFASGKGRVFVSGLGNNTVEVIDLFQGTLAHEIPNVPNPQGVAFSPDANKLFVASGTAHALRAYLFVPAEQERTQTNPLRLSCYHSAGCIDF